MTVKPITPAQASKRKISSIPDFILESVNELIAEKIGSNSHRVSILHAEIVDRAVSKMQEMVVYGDSTTDDLRNTIFTNNWLDFEPLYRKAGWSVEYDRPGFNESYSARFNFTKKG